MLSNVRLPSLTVEFYFLLLVMTVIGCGKTPEKLFPVDGTVSLGGKPITNGTVQFEMLEKGESGKVYTSSGAIDEDGHYQLKTFGEPGAPAGNHRAWVVPNFAAKGMPDKIGIGVNRMTSIPRKYMVPTTTDLEYEVSAGENSIDIEIPAK